METSSGRRRTAVFLWGESAAFYYFADGLRRRVTKKTQKTLDTFFPRRYYARFKFMPGR